MADEEVYRLYPELARGGRLAHVIASELRTIGSAVVVEDPLGAAYAIARVNRRECQAHVALGKRAFGADFWDRGVRYGHVRSTDLRRVAAAVHSFLHLKATSSQLEQAFPEIEICAEGRAHERGALVDFQWTQFLAKRPPVWPDDLLHDVFALAAAGRFRALMPFTSLSRACFSTRTGFPYTCDCPAIEVLRDGRASLFAPGQMDGDAPLLTGPLAEVVVRAEAILPSGVTAARDGTAEDDAA